MNTYSQEIKGEDWIGPIHEPIPPMSIMVIDHDVHLREQLHRELGAIGFAIRVATGEQHALRQMAEEPCDLAILNDALPGTSSESIINHLKALSPNSDIILLADHTTRLYTLEMTRNNLYTYFTKPLDVGELKRTLVHRAHERHQDEPPGTPTLPGPVPVSGSLMPVVGPPPPVAAPKREPNLKTPRSRGETEADSVCFIGESKSIQHVREQVINIAPTTMTVLIHGESGVGKGAVARLIHAQSGRARHENFIPINCPAIPESLMESELFGHDSGAFTGAEGAKPGRLELANGGTAFLDEIGEIPLTMQVKLLHVIENKEIYHLGGRKPIKIDVRFVAATNAPLEQMITTGHFRPDLFYRLDEFSIYIPPLRERIEDIPVLVNHFLKIYGPKYGRDGLTLSPPSMSRLIKYHWPGNVRELETVMRRFALCGDEESIHTQLNPRSRTTPERTDNASMIRQNEIQTILAVLTEAHWNQRRAAKILGLSYSALRRRIDKYGLMN